MTASVALLVLFFASHAAIAQQPKQDGSPGANEAFWAAERSRLNEERVRIQSIYEDDSALCYKKFAVNDCLKEARNVRRDLLADLRRQEVSMNAAQARLKGAERISAAEEKASLDAQKKRAQQQEQAHAEQQERQRSAEERAAARDRSAQERELGSAQRANRVNSKTLSDAERSAKAAAADAARQRYEEKLRLAKQRQETKQKELAQRKQSAASAPHGSLQAPLK